jgi:hypothetical protein
MYLDRAEDLVRFWTDDEGEATSQVTRADVAELRGLAD